MDSRFLPEFTWLFRSWSSSSSFRIIISHKYGWPKLEIESDSSPLFKSFQIDTNPKIYNLIIHAEDHLRKNGDIKLRHMSWLGIESCCRKKRMWRAEGFVNGGISESSKFCLHSDVPSRKATQARTGFFSHGLFFTFWVFMFLVSFAVIFFSLSWAVGLKGLKYRLYVSVV